jgi:hypothetical protein
MKTALILTIAVIGCGGAAKPDSTAPGGEPARLGTDQKHDMGHMDHQGGDHEANMPPQVAAFHDALAPRWHAPHGPQRMTDTCAAVPSFRGDAEAIAAAQPPAGGDAAAWSTGGKQLAEAVAALDTTCKASDAAAFEPAFERVHTAFHHVMAAAGAHHEEPGTDEHAHDREH